MACTATITGISLSCQTGVGGVEVAYGAIKDDVTAITVTDGKVSAITMAMGKNFCEYELHPERSNFSSSQQGDDVSGVDYIQSDVMLSWTHMETSKRTAIESLVGNKLVVIVKDNNGKYWLIGKDRPAKVTARTAESGTAMGDANAYSVTITGKDNELPIEVDSSIIAELLS